MITGGIMVLPGQFFNVPSLKDDIRSGPDVSAVVAKVQLDDEGMSRVTRKDHRPTLAVSESSRHRVSGDTALCDRREEDSGHGFGRAAGASRWVTKAGRETAAGAAPGGP
ncbi:hypothetical protein [Streptomyces anulatus]|uniref:hypothetical protein n=1 Tax=Streptomyces anulatus TaxID=1892 RepID=UPI003664418B